ncbi:peptidylprolyl isomerase [Melissospora conviva]|uniref:peptidylprolyl isomerase n=1 Tax=Melissospora conviva TaxID=3388432 RepID=UPI003B81CBF7
MASSRDRQRKLARAKLDRQMARRAASLRRRRRIQAGIGATAALVLVLAGALWAGGVFDSKPADNLDAADETCLWVSQDSGANPEFTEVGKPEATGLPTEGVRTMTIGTNQGGPITAELDLAEAPCAAASISYLAGQGFYDNTVCHEITAEGALRCGDPSGSGFGGPTYTFPDDNIADTGDGPAYPAGTVAMIGAPKGANGSQFLIFFKDFDTDDPQYPVVGKVTDGMKVVEKIGKLPTVENANAEKVKPETDVVIESLTVSAPVAATVAPQPSDATSPQPSSSASAG